jgi:RNA polymerase sigma-70 factor, ECF subfamily
MRVPTTLVLGSLIRGEPVAAAEGDRPARRPRPEPPRSDAPDEGAPDPRPTWQQVVDEHGDRIYTIAYRLTGNREDAADLTQDVFVRVFRNLHRYEPGTFAGWLYRITKNLFLDRVRRQQRIRMEALPDEEWRGPVSGEPGPADVVERATLEARLEEGLARLPEEFRLAVVYCDVVGLSYEEIARATGWPIGTVRSRIHRGRRQLREHLERVAEPDAPETTRRRADG